LVNCIILSLINPIIVIHVFNQLLDNKWPNQQKNQYKSVYFVYWFGHIDSDSTKQKIVDLVKSRRKKIVVQNCIFFYSWKFWIVDLFSSRFDQFNNQINTILFYMYYPIHLGIIGEIHTRQGVPNFIDKNHFNNQESSPQIVEESWFYPCT